MDIQSLRKRYAPLCGFLGAWFPDADIEGMTDAEAARESARVTDEEEVEAILSQAREVLAEQPAFWREVGEQANRYFENPEQAGQWLSDILREIEAERAVGDV